MPDAGIGPEVGRHLLRGAQRDVEVVGDGDGVEAKLRRARAVDGGIEGRRVDLLLEMGVDDAGNGRDAPAQLLGDAEVGGAVVADRPHVDLRGKAEVQDLGHDVGRLEIEHDLGKRRRQGLAQLADVVGRRRMAFLERHQDHAVVHADGRAVGEGEIVGPRRQSDVVDDQLAVALGDDFADLVLDGLEDALGRLDARAGRGADMELDLAAVDQRKEVAADEDEQRPRRARGPGRRRSER